MHNIPIIYVNRQYNGMTKLSETLTHFPMDKMGAISQTTFSFFFINEKFCILIRISRKCVPKGLIDNKPALVQVMACRLFGAKPLPEPMMT